MSVTKAELVVNESQVEEILSKVGSNLRISFASRQFVTERANGESSSLNYDELEERSEGSAHRALKYAAASYLARLDYQVYVGGVGVAGHNGYCDGLGIRDGQVVFFEALTKWAVLDAEQFQRKLHFTNHAPLILALTRNSSPLARVRLRKARPAGVYMASLSEDSANLRIKDPAHDIFRPRSPFTCPVRVSVNIASRWATIDFDADSGDDWLQIERASFLIRQIRGIFDALIGKTSGRINRRQVNRRFFDSQFIGRDQTGRETGRITLNTLGNRATVKLESNQVTQFLGLTEKLADTLGLSLDRGPGYSNIFR